jgi:hypothetical protein
MTDVDVLSIEIKNLKDSFERLEMKIDEHIQKTDVKDEKFESRLRNIEDWKLKFVSKLTVYSAIALFCGTIFSQVAIKLLTNYLSK